MAVPPGRVRGQEPALIFAQLDAHALSAVTLTAVITDLLIYGDDDSDGVTSAIEEVLNVRRAQALKGSVFR
jgi:hypothetical protein